MEIAQAQAQADAAAAEAKAAQAEAQKAQQAAAAAAAAASSVPTQPAMHSMPVQYTQLQPAAPPVPSALPAVPPPIREPVFLQVVTPHIVDENSPAMQQHHIISVSAGAVVQLIRGSLVDGLEYPYQEYIEVQYNNKVGKISKHIVKRVAATSVPEAISSWGGGIFKRPLFFSALISSILPCEITTHVYSKSSHNLNKPHVIYISHQL